MIRALKFTKETGIRRRVGKEETCLKREGEKEREREGTKKTEATLGFTRHVTLMKIAEDEL